MKRLIAFSLVLILSFLSLSSTLITANSALKTGDINSNGEIDSMDYVLLKRAYFGTYDFDEATFQRGDIDGNGEITSMDYVLLKRAYFGTYVITEPDEESSEDFEDSSATDSSSTPESTPDIDSSAEESSTPESSEVESSEVESSEAESSEVESSTPISSEDSSVESSEDSSEDSSEPEESIPDGEVVELTYGKSYVAEGLYHDGTTYPYPDENGKSMTDGIIAGKEATYSDPTLAGFNANTDYCKQNGYVSITVDLDCVCYLSEIVAYVATANEANTGAGVLAPSLVEFYISKDNSTWTKAGEVVPITNNSDTNAALTLATPVGARYIQYRFKSYANWIMVSEIKAYGISSDPSITPNPTPTPAPSTPVETVLFDSSNLTNYSAAFLPSYAPFALYDTGLFTNTVVTEISFPYYGLVDGYTTSSNGLYLPIYVISTDLSTSKESCTVENGKKIILDFTGKLNGVSQGDWITASGLNITVGANETLAFGDTDMVVLPMFLRDNGTYGFWNRVFTTKGTNNHSLIFKIKGYSNKPGIPSINDGKNTISFMGDSISTFTNWSNNTSYNSTIGGNAVWYPNTGYTGGNITVEQTWWYRTATALNREICVNNSWSGSVVTTSTAYNVRARNLHNTTTNTSPDVVVIFMGINDCAAGTAIGSYNGIGTPSSTPTTFSEAYGRMIYTIQTTYPGVEIYCCTILPDEKRAASDNETEYNTAIRTVATNMGAKVIDLYSNTGITASNISNYTVDKLHPNAAGMQLISNVVVNAIK